MTPTTSAPTAALRPRVFRLPGWLWAALALLALGLLAGWGVRGYQLAQALQRDVADLQALAEAPSVATLRAAGPTLTRARADVEAARREAAPVFWLAPALGWVPEFGPDLAAAPALVDYAAALLAAADEGYQGLAPLLAADAALDGPAVARALTDGAARLAAAREALTAAMAARERFDPERLSPRVRKLIARLDPLLSLVGPGLDLALAGPALLGVEAPQTYLLLAQNEDELRATGGFISAAGTLTLADGAISGLALEDSYALDDFSHPYPEPPAAIRNYLLGELWLLRDSNWSPDFPTAAAQAEAFYTLARPTDFGGVIAFDQAALRLLLEATGPVVVPGTPTPVSADNVTDYVRAAWSPDPDQALDRAWWEHRKDFMPALAAAVLERLPAADPAALALAARTALEGRHVQFWFRHPGAAGALGALGWDGAVRVGDGDFLMIVDSNLGFNKMNAVVRSIFDYAVDLSAVAGPGPEARPTAVWPTAADAAGLRPTATLTVTVLNPAEGGGACVHVADYGTGQYEDMLARCYWDLQRVLVPAGAELLEATPQDVPGEWLLSGAAVNGPPAVAVGEGGATVFERLQVVSAGATAVARYTYALPAGVVVVADGRAEYRLRVQKQAGAADQRLHLRIGLPPGARLLESSHAGVIDQGAWVFDQALSRDLEVRLVFSLTP